MKKAAAGERTAHLPGCAAGAACCARRRAGSLPGWHAPIPLLQRGVSQEHRVLLGLCRLCAGLDSEQHWGWR